MTSTPAPTEDRSEVTSVIKHEIKEKDHAAYEGWLRKIVPVAAQFPGHRGVNIIRPSKGSTEYTIVLHFDTIDNLRTWLDSKQRGELIAEVLPILVGEDRVEIKTGLEFWFTPPSKQQRAAPYKQFLITLSVIYPLTILVPLLMVPVFDRIPLLGNSYIRQIFVDALIVALMTYVIMPRYTRAIAKWLYQRIDESPHD
jgi:antibiotic biosynthesis monooxygenase (ABM) superfamily enzyme